MGRASFVRNVVTPPLEYVKYTAVGTPSRKQYWLRRVPHNLCRGSLMMQSLCLRAGSDPMGLRGLVAQTLLANQ